MKNELFFIDPSTHLELARKVVTQVGRFQGWDEVEVIGRKVELLGQEIEEVYFIGHARLEAYEAKDGISFRFSRPDFVVQAWQWVDLFKQVNLLSGCGVKA